MFYVFVGFCLFVLLVFYFWLHFCWVVFLFIHFFVRLLVCLFWYDLSIADSLLFFEILVWCGAAIYGAADQLNSELSARPGLSALLWGSFLSLGSFHINSFWIWVVVICWVFFLFVCFFFAWFIIKQLIWGREGGKRLCVAMLLARQRSKRYNHRSSSWTNTNETNGLVLQTKQVKREPKPSSGQRMKC